VSLTCVGSGGGWALRAPVNCQMMIALARARPPARSATTHPAARKVAAKAIGLTFLCPGSLARAGWRGLVRLDGAQRRERGLQGLGLTAVLGAHRVQGGIGALAFQRRARRGSRYGPGAIRPPGSFQ
jgi:hypothetical protein